MDDIYDDILKINIVQSNDVIAIIEIDGTINVDTVNSLNTTLEKLEKKDNPKNIIFKCSGIKFVSSIGIGCFMNLYKSVLKKNGKLVFVGVHGNMKESFRLLRLDKFFYMKENVRDALIEINLNH